MKKRFCMLTTFYPPFHFGGDAIGIQRLCRGLAARGHEVTIIHDEDAYLTLAGREPAAEVHEPDGIRVVGLRSSWGRISNLLTQQLGRPVIHGSRIARILKEGHFDVINFHNISLVGGPGLLKYGDATKIYMAHEHWLVCESHVLWRHGRELCDKKECLRCVLSFRRPPQLWRRTSFLHRSLDHMDAIIAMSEFSREKHREFGLPHDMEVMPYFLPRSDREGPLGNERLHPRPYFLFVGRLEKIKGLDDVLETFRSYDRADLVIAGDGEYAACLKKQAEGLSHVHFLGRVDPDELSGWYAGAMALIVPSVCFETFGIILIESFRQGTPVIARRLGPFVEIVTTSGAGHLFENGEELVEAMESFHRDSGHRDDLSRRARSAFEEHWSEDVVIPRYLEIVEKAEGRHRMRLASPLKENL